MFRAPLALVAILVLAMTAPTVAAQPYPTDFVTVTTRGELWRIDRNGVTSLLSTVARISDGIAISADNQGILWTDFGPLTTVAGSVHEWRNGANRTLFTTNDFRVEEVVVNQNGEIAFSGRDTSRTPPVSGLFKWSGGTTIGTIATTTVLGQGSLALNGGLAINVDTGNYLLGTGAGVAPSQVWDVAENGFATPLITSTPFPPTNRYTIAQDRATGDLYQSGTVEFNVIAGGTTTSLHPTGIAPISYQALLVDRASVPTPSRLLYSIVQSTSTVNAFVHAIQDPLGTPTYTSTAVAVGPGTLGATAGCAFDRGRNVGTTKRGPGTYDVHVDFPGEANRAYAIGLSATGYAPAVPVNGVDICLAVDVFTVLSVQGLLRPWFDPGPGVLDSNGRAAARIALGTDNVGLRVWLVAVTIQGGQVRTASSPVVMNL